MSTSILLIAHAPLAHALRECALHVFADCGDAVAALDVPPHEPPEQTLANARALLAGLATESTLVLTDVFGATPCNVAQRLVDRLTRAGHRGQPSHGAARGRLPCRDPGLPRLPRCRGGHPGVMQVAHCRTTKRAPTSYP